MVLVINTECEDQKQNIPILDLRTTLRILGLKIIDIGIEFKNWLQVRDNIDFSW